MAEYNSQVDSALSQGTARQHLSQAYNSQV